MPFFENAKNQNLPYMIKAIDSHFLLESNNILEKYIIKKVHVVDKMHAPRYVLRQPHNNIKIRNECRFNQ